MGLQREGQTATGVWRVVSALLSTHSKALHRCMANASIRHPNAHAWQAAAAAHEGVQQQMDASRCPADSRAICADSSNQTTR